jgi:hypothetical protein
MKRYYNDEPEPEGFFGPEDENYDEEEELIKQAMMAEQQGVMSDQQLNTLAVAITFLSANFFWRFKSYKTKLKELNEVYLSFQQLMDNS